MLEDNNQKNIEMDIKQNKRSKLEKKLRGFQKANRERFLLISNKVLSGEEFLLYEICIALTDWDRSHDTYGTFSFTNQELSYLLGWKSDTTAGRHKKSLIQKGFLIDLEDGYYKVLDFEKWELRKQDDAKIQPLSANLEPINAEIENKPAKMQEKQAQNDDYSLVSSKGNNNFVRSYEEYKEIKRSGVYKLLEIDDMQWIDKNVLY